MNQKQLAEKTGIRPALISHLYRGTLKPIPVDMLNKLWDAFHSQPGDLPEHRPDENN